MDSKLINFITALRNHDVRISTSESLDAMRVLALVGYSDRTQLKNALGSTLAKTIDEKSRFDHCFELFFGGDRLKAAILSEQDLQNEISQQQEKTHLNIKDEIAADPAIQATIDSPLAQALIDNKQSQISSMVAAAAGENPGDKLQYFTQKGQQTRRLMESMGQERLDQNIEQLLQLHSATADYIAEALKQRKQQLRSVAQQQVEEQLLLTANAEGRKLQDNVLQNTRLSALEARHFDQLQTLVQKMAKKLSARHARVIKPKRKGRLDVAKTLRKNIHYDSILFDTYWKKKRKDQPKVFALCDVSGSVAAYAKFLLLFLYSLNDVLPKIRSFCFSNRTGEVTQLFSQHDAAKAIELAFKQWGYGSSDYGQSLLDFSNLCLDSIDNNSTVIILGDARNNQMDGRLDILQSVYHRAKTVIWLNPEARSHWGTGDSIIRRYQTACNTVNECRSLRQLERIVDRLLKLTR
jgi:uncharacterized protein